MRSLIYGLAKGRSGVELIPNHVRGVSAGANDAPVSPPPRLSPHTRSCTARALRLTGSSIRVGGWTAFLARALAREWRDSAPRIFRRAYSAGDMG